MVAAASASSPLRRILSVILFGIAFGYLEARFRFAGIPPGEYRIAAWEEIERGLGTVPEFRVKFEDKATAVKVGESDHARINVLLIPRDAIDAEAAKLK